MATINSVQLYLSRRADNTGWNINVDIHAVTAYTLNPTIGAVLGSKTVAIDSVPEYGSQAWVTFTFDTPITISETNFYAIHVWCDTSDYQATGLRWYEADDWDDAAGGEPYTGKERFWTRNDAGAWDAGESGAYRINCTDCDDNEAESPTEVYDNFREAGSSYGHGVRTYLNAAAAAVPSDPINPVPIHGSGDTILSNNILSWEDGGGGETYDVYFRPFGEFFEKVASDITDLSVDVKEFLHNRHYLYGDLYFWCVIAKNEYGGNHIPPEGFALGYGGTIWEFNAMLFGPPLPTGVALDYSGDPDDEDFGEPTGTPTGENNMISIRKLVVAAKNTIFVEDI